MIGTETAKKASVEGGSMPTLAVAFMGMDSNGPGVRRGIGRFLANTYGPDQVNVYASDAHIKDREARVSEQVVKHIQQGGNVTLIGNSAGNFEVSRHLRKIRALEDELGEKKEYLSHITAHRLGEPSGVVMTLARVVRHLWCKTPNSLD